jgi:hypothetical protein
MSPERIVPRADLDGLSENAAFNLSDACMFSGGSADESRVAREMLR